MLQLTTNLHYFHQRGTDTDIYAAISELCYANNIEIISLVIKPVRLDNNSTYANLPLKYYCTLEGHYGQVHFHLRYNVLGLYTLYIHQDFICTVDNFYKILTTCQLSIAP